MQIGVETARAVETKRVFVIDDDDITRTVLQFILQDDNETHDLATLAEAYAQGGRAQPDMVLLGLGIVEREGNVVLTNIAARWPRARILLIAGPGQEATAQDDLAPHAHAVLTKPFTVETVRRRVNAQFGRLAPATIQLHRVPVSAL